ncbi:hypothetical protein JW872_03195 [Candidatus Babeliales bacterium]|nr:hypothetical protein [Candidatus Babeliales bacterium]
MNRGFVVLALLGGFSASYGMVPGYAREAERRIVSAEKYEDARTEGQIGRACDAIGCALAAVSLAGHRHDHYSRLYRLAGALMPAANIVGSHRRVREIQKRIGRRLGLEPAPWEIAEEEVDFYAEYGLHCGVLPTIAMEVD